MSSAPMLERLRRSLAFRLAIQYSLVFALVAGALFTALYWELAGTLEARDRAAVEQLAGRLGQAYDLGGAAALKVELDSNASPEVRSYFVRVIDSSDAPVFQWVPQDWIQTQVQKIPFPAGWGITATRQVRSVRIPDNALKDYTIATTQLSDGSMMQVGRSIDSRAVLLRPLRRAFAGVGAVALALSVAVGTLLAWRSTRPLRLVSDTARRIVETGDFAARVPGASGSGELALLVRQFNTLLEKNSAHVRVLRETLDNLAHDLRTPLARLRGTAELALNQGGDPAEARSALADCVDETDRLLHVIESLLDLSAAEGGALRLNRKRIDLRSIAERAADLYREVAEERRIAVALDLPEPVEVEADPVRLGQAVNNLLDNALKYTPEGGNVTVSVAGDSGGAALSVTDNGPGVPAAEREAIFRRLYRGDASRSQRGLGLGLSLVKAIVESHGGTVTVDESPGGGARFKIRLERAGPARPAG
ncbi:MAG: HAMP domain-containing sensor histidine kinase [Opitutaceae bacterium]